MSLERIQILGENSFVGKSLYNFLASKCLESQIISKQTLNFLDVSTFSNLIFSNSIIIDFVNVNNGVESEIMNCNFYGFKNFIDYLKSTQINVTYVYISTISVLSVTAVNSSVYVKSKKLAEDYLIDSGLNYQIQRLSYPIGRGENNKRLISRIIKDLKEGKTITVNNTLINLNDINDVVNGIFSQLLKNRISFISNNKYLYLSDIVFFLKEAIKSKSQINVEELENKFVPVSDTPTELSDIKETLLKMI